MPPGRKLITLLLVLGGCRCSENGPAPVRVRVTGQPTLLLELGAKPTAAAAGPGGLFAVGTSRGEVLLVKPGERVAQAAGTAHDGAVTVVQLSPDGRYLLSIGGKTATLVDVGSRNLLRQVRGHS